MFDERFMTVVSKEGVVAIVSCSDDEAHVVNTWNSYLAFPGENRMLIPVYGMRKTQKKVEKNNNVLLTLGTKEIEGKMGPGTGYLISGTARFMNFGPEFDLIKQKFSWANRVLEVTVSSVKQTI
ncbi:pyridoxamine 5'-phosphate oxidase family protein [Desulfopila aestuarii]|uniref:Pyridoxamine 5'-phosphate oxidase n=1 Tax=Desulfopila aestuarii DSM 18488 TaxID=1121416 RepID=A0A1M7YLJ5_9BACT|nr:pyridoxamine 5'-phosphate oxidase family protein [Desulfopila aestuarii]SHO53481.1 Pyridoxamine 5'-phosphate oxidase [Desulfopila aestuarii DSM 18488]